MAFCKPEFIIIKSNYFQNAQKDECFLDDSEAFALVTSARTSISRTTMRLRNRNVILKVVSSKITIMYNHTFFLTQYYETNCTGKSRYSSDILF
jgi:hypothetical protein